jgi:phosphoenolpyruvate synthase/pyruvate phosphate dikinase
MRVQEALWEALTKQYEAARVQEAKEIPAVRVLDAANVPERKSPSARKIIVILGTAFSFLIACVVVFVTNVWEEMDPQNEGKVLVTEVWNGTLNSLAWVCHLPGMRWVCARFEKSK